jgi:hypothetical protein
MTLRKLFEILNALHAWDHMKGMITCTGGGELAIQFNGQPQAPIDQYLRRKGFIINAEYLYVYRPE